MSYSATKFSRQAYILNADGTQRPGTYWVVRRSRNQSRILEVGQETGPGELVPTNLIKEEWGVTNTTLTSETPQAPEQLLQVQAPEDTVNPSETPQDESEMLSEVLPAEQELEAVLAN